MSSAGSLTIKANWQGGCLNALDVVLARPPVARLFIGESPEAVVKAVPYLYSLCASAQRVVAQAALAAAAEVPRRPADDAELWREVLHEGFWRLLLDWPPALGLPAAEEDFIAWRATRLTDACVEATQSLLDGSLADLAEKCLAKLVDRDHASTHARLLDVEGWLAYWQGRQVVMPPVPIPVSVAAAYRARLADLRLAAQALASAAPFPVAARGDSGWGVAQCQTARGTLTHAVHLVDGVVASYRVQAPTDDHFVDATALASLFDGQTCTSLAEARKRLEQAILALDPCLPYALELNYA